MAIISRKLSTYAKDVKALSDTPNDDGLTAAQLKAVFMGAADEEIKTNHNGLIDDLVSKVDGSSGADNIGATAVKVGGSETVQGILEELKTEKVDKVAGKGLSTNDYDNTEKANVASNTSARHTHSNKALLDTYTQTEANLADAVTKKHAHANLTALNNVSGVNTGDQDLSGYALKTNVLEKTNTTAFTPTADHHPATKKYVDDNAGSVPYLSTINGLVTAIVDDDTKLPTSGAVVDYVAGLGGGDMLKATYDPTNKAADAFAMANMVEGTTNKIFTATERTKLNGIEDNANNYVHPTTAGNKHIPTGGSADQYLKYSADGTAVWSNIPVLLESCIVTVSTSDSQPVAGQTITLTNLTDGTLTETYTLLAGETSHTFKVIPTQTYKISVDAKSTYVIPAESAIFSAVAGNIRNVTMSYEKMLRYGYRRTKSESNPDTRITYLFDAVGMTPAYMDFGTGNFNYGSWQTFTEEVSRPVMLKTDGTVDYELSRNDMTKKVDGVTASDVSNTSYAGNAMIEFRKYKWVKRYEDATYEYVIFSNGNYDGTYNAYAHTDLNGVVKDEFYWGAFKGSNVSSKLRSVADQTVMVSQTRNTEVSYATANGNGYYTIYKSGWEYIGDLLTLISKSDNSQTKFGSGRSKSTNTTAIATGTLKAQPYFKGYNDETSDVKVFGIEGFWGNVWEGMAGLVYNGQIRTKMTPPYNFDGTGYTLTGVTPSGTNGGFINTASVTDASGFVPKTASGSGTTYYCDGLWFNNSQVDYALVGGGWDDALRDGCRCVNLDSLASRAYAAVGSRLSYINPA